MDLDLRYPIGRFESPVDVADDQIEFWISEIERLPPRLRELALSLSSYKLDSTYREGGWNGRQVINHIADSHMNSIIRYKLALTELNPDIKPYFEDRWANLPDYKGPVEPALDLIESLHVKWVHLLRQMTIQDFSRTYFHPESKRSWTLAETTALYAWHGEHHLGHLNIIRNQK